MYNLHSSDTFVISAAGILSLLATNSMALKLSSDLLSGFKQERNLKSVFSNGSLLCRKAATALKIHGSLTAEPLVDLP